MAAGHLTFVLQTLSSNPVAAPVPILAVWTVATGTLVITFDLPLMPGVGLAVLGISGCDGAFALDLPAPGTAAGNTYTMAIGQLGVPCGLAQITYDGTDPELQGSTGIPVAPFANFPLTVV